MTIRARLKCLCKLGRLTAVHLAEHSAIFVIGYFLPYNYSIITLFSALTIISSFCTILQIWWAQ